MGTTKYGFDTPPLGWLHLSAMGTAILDGTLDQIGGVYIAPKAGTLDRIQVYCTAITGTPPDYLVQLETVSAGLPSNSIIASGRSGTFTPTAATLHTITLGTSYSVALNEVFAVTLQPSGAATGGNNATFNLRCPILGHFSSAGDFYPRAVQDLSAGTWSLQNYLPTCVPLYSDGSYIPGSAANVSIANVDVASDTTPDEVGIRWTQAGNDKTYGARLNFRWFTASASFKLQLYRVADGDSAAPVRTTTWTYSTYNRGTTEVATTPVYWSSAYDLVDGEDYRIGIVPTTTNDLRMQTGALATEAARRALSHYYYTSRTRTADGDAGAWTDDTARMFSGLAPVTNEAAAAAAGGAINPLNGMIVAR